ncbi:MAG: tetratricopeptide repeat protein [bacterium]|nr:tetratricopeptide repeat protein [bacterium]
MRRVLSLCVLPAIVLSLAPAAPAYQDGPDPAQRSSHALESFRRYLDRKPYNAWAFDSLLEAAVAVNALPKLVERYEARVAEDPGDLPARVVLARLYARTDQTGEGIDLLAAVEERDGQLLALVGELELERGDTAAATAALDAAAAATQDEKLLEEIHRARGRAYLIGGDREEAANAFRALAELAPDNFHLRLEAATALADNGLSEEALVEFETAESLAGGDNAKRCRVLAEMGRLHEQRSDGEAALGVYARAIGLMGRGNWLKRELYERVLALHQRSGTLPALVASSRADSGANAQDLDAREFHARVLAATGDWEAATGVLRAAAAEFQDDLRVSRQLLDVLEQAGDTDGRIQEYQRILAQQPDELELYLELGRLFATEGRLELARLQWQRTLESRLDNPALCSRLANLYALYDMTEDARALFERAIELEPGEVAPYAELSSFLAAHDARDEVPAVLERAAARVAGDARRLEELANSWKEYGDTERARKTIEEAVTADPGQARLRFRLATLLAEEGDSERAAHELHAVIGAAGESTLARSATDRLVRLFQKDGRLAQLAARERAAIENDPDDATPYLVLGTVHARQRRPGEAIDVLRALLERAPDHADARLMLARQLERIGELGPALESYRALIEARPQARRKHLKAIAAIHLQRYEQDEAFACYDEILAGAPDNPAAFREVADAYSKLGYHEKALECLRQAVRLTPDDGRMRLRLAELYDTIGEKERAQEEVLAATRTRDDDVVEKARSRYYTLVSEAGAVDEEIARLRARIDTNPYDTEAPIGLTDFYVRELEYELALEMIDRLLTYRPKAPELLSERARLYALMERHDEALADYDTLWKLPDADQTELALKIGEAALQRGDRERARRVLAGVQDLSRVAALYRELDLTEDAIETYQRGLARAPQDVRLLMRLAGLYESKGDEESAILTLERVLDLRGNSWRVVRRVGGLLYDVGREDEAIEYGKRLFALARIEDHDDDEVDEGEPAPSDPFAMMMFSRRSSSNALTQRMNELRSYFTDKGLDEQFATIGAEELVLQPTNTTLLSYVLSALAREDGQGERAHEVIESVRAGTVAANRTPPGYTAKSWTAHLDGRELSALRSDKPFGEKRAAQLETSISGDSPTPRAFLELAGIYSYFSKKEELLKTLERGVAAHPDSEHLLAGLAMTHASENRFEPAADALERLIATLEARPDSGENEAANALAFEGRRRSLYGGFPYHVRRRISDDDVRRLFDLTRGTSFALGWGLGREPKLPGARRKLAHCFVELGRSDEARTILAALEPGAETALVDWINVGAAYYEEEMYADAERVYKKLAQLETQLDADPVLGFNRTWARRFDAPMKQLARIHERRGEFVAAYGLLRRYGDGKAGELMLATNDATASVIERYSGVANAAEEGGDAWRDALVLIAELHQSQREWDAAQAIYARIGTARPRDFAALDNLADLHTRADRWEDAIRVHEATALEKRALARRPSRPSTPPGRELVPTAIELPKSDEDWAWNNLRSGRSVFFSGGPRAASADPRDNYVEILKLYLDHREISKATEVMRKLTREDMRTFRWIGHSLTQILDSYRLGASGIPIYRLIWSNNQNDEYLGRQLADALLAAKDYEDARRIYRHLAGDSTSSSYTRDHARKQLRVVDGLLGTTGPEEKDLLASVEADPKNVKVRMKLAQQLFDDGDWDAAFEHAQVAEELAPHLDETTALVENCLQVLGKHPELEERLLAELEETPAEAERIRIAAQLANWAWMRGDKDAARALFEGVARKRGSGLTRYTPAAWYMEKGDYETARTILEEELDDSGPRGRSDAEAALLKVRLILGDAGAALEEDWEAFEKLTTPGARANVVFDLARTLRQLPLVGQKKDELLALAGEHEGMRGTLYAAAAELATGDIAGCEGRLAALVEADEDTLFLVPTLVTLARERSDWKSALGYLEVLLAAEKTSQNDKVSTSIGSLSEHSSLLAEIGSLRLALGDEDGARDAWSRIFAKGGIIIDDDKESFEPLAKLYAEHELWDDAVGWLGRHIEEVGERRPNVVLFLAEIERGRGNDAAEIEALERAAILARGNEMQTNEIRADLLAAHRHAGSVADYLTKLREQAESDPDDLDLTLRVARLTSEVESEDAALAVLEPLLERPNMRDKLLPTFLAHAKRSGERERAIEHLQAMCEGTSEPWRRTTHAKELARLLLEAERVDEAVEALKSSHANPALARAQYDIAQALFTAGLAEQALPYYEEAVRLEPATSYFRRQLESCLVKLGRAEHALEQNLAYLATKDGAYQSRHNFPAVRKSLVESEGRARAVEAAAAAPDDFEANLRAAATSTIVDGVLAGAPYFERLLELRPDDHVALSWGTKLRAAQDRHAEALELVERRIVLLDNLQGVVGGRTVTNTIDTLRSERARLLLKLGDREAAVAALHDDLGRRFVPVREQDYRYTRHFDNRMSRVIGLMWTHGLLEEYVEETKRQELLGHRLSAQGSVYRSLHALGRTDEAIEMMWEEYIDPLEGLLAPKNDNVFFGPTRIPSATSNRNLISDYSKQATLLGIHREAGIVDELLTRIKKMRKRFPNDDKLEELHQYVLEQEERFEDLTPFLREALAADPWKPSRLADVARNEKRVGNALDAIALFEQALAIRRAEAIGTNAMFGITSFSSGGLDGGPTKIRFAWSDRGRMGFSGGSSFTSISGPTNDESADTTIARDLTVLYRSLGRVPEADALEHSVLYAGGTSEWARRQAYERLESAYREARLLDDMERVARLAIDALTGDNAGLRQPIRKRVVRGLLDVGETERAQPWIDASLAYFQERVDGSSEKERASGHLARGVFFGKVLGDAERARADLETYLAERDDTTRPSTQLAELRLVSGDFEGALKELREHLEEARHSSPQVHQRVDLQLGLALAEVEGIEAARPYLVRALAWNPDQDLADRARRLLDE